MNWGTKIVLGLGTFMSFIIVLAVIMFNSKTDALVEQDYYEKGIHYDETFNRKEQVIKDHAAPLISIQPELLNITFSKPAKGTIRMVRNSDKKQDRIMHFETDTAMQVNLPLGGLKKGAWKLIAEWDSADKTYLTEQEIQLP
ncbi:FixH family protein [Pedobacter antarcticus]|uniref:FixH family protein n=1 Tax=Pedobacter antarcticus TaxID=34086 RepID=UPI001C56D372|nr:FixH family protein [Pedobacter antarcticus]